MSPRARTRAPQDGADRSFYAAALAAADRVALEEARHVEGLAEEIALLRVRLRQALADHADDTKLIETGCGCSSSRCSHTTGSRRNRPRT